ncbi:MAG: EI24 domain-containing protein [Epsilonproteobacteria bacterium]|nr:EI24 domain-containing protein [Campylobacterota bacterium]
MQDFFDSIIFAYEKITKVYMMRFIVAVGFGVFVFWGVLGYLFWDDIIRISSDLIELVPFSFIKKNTATLASAFIYMNVVLISFAIVYMFVINLYMEKLKQSYGGLISLSVVMISAVFWGIVWFEKGEFIHTQLEKLFTWLPFETVEKTLAYLLGFYLIYTMIIVTTTVMASLLSKKYLFKVKEEEFPYDLVYEENEKVLFHTIRDMGLYIIASVLLFPLLFIPGVNVFSQIILWVWFAKDTLMFDSATILFDEPTKDDLKKYSSAIWGIGIVGSLFNFIPVMNIFGPFFSEIAMFYYLKQKRDIYYEG